MNELHKLRWLVAAVVVLQLGACGSLPAPQPRPITMSIAASPSTELGAVVASGQPFPEASGFRLLRSGAAALEARIALISQPEISIDLQYYHFSVDAVGSRIVEELRAAARRRVRVRLLVDDLHTFGSDAVLLNLAREPNIEVRLFNPFVTSRGALSSRLLSSIWDFRRVNARMHNKLLVADGALAIVGGRNIADAYFDPAGGSAYLDLDVLIAGAVLQDLGRIFDAYWNNDIVYPVEHIVRLNETRVGETDFVFVPIGPDNLGAAAPASVVQRIERDSLGMSWGWAEAFSDSPNKWKGQPSLIGPRKIQTAAQMRELIWSEMAQAPSEYMIMTPYLVPGDGGMRTVRNNRERGVRISIVTNSLASTDEPLVHLGYRRYRRQMLENGVELYELSADHGWRLNSSITSRQSYGLHTKCVVFDRDTVYVGSLNFDPRSEAINTEAGLLIRSAELAEEIYDYIEDAKLKALYSVTLTPEGQVQWSAAAWETDGRVIQREPAASIWRRLLLELLGPLVPESLL